MLRKRIRLLEREDQADATVTGDVHNSNPRLYTRALGRLRSTANTTGTLDVTIQHNDDPDATTGWKNLIVFTQQTNETGDDGVEDVHVPWISTHLFPHLRAVAVVADTGDYTFTVDLWLD